MTTADYLSAWAAACDAADAAHAAHVKAQQDVINASAVGTTWEALYNLIEEMEMASNASALASRTASRCYGEYIRHLRG